MKDITFSEFLEALTDLVEGKKKEEKAFYGVQDLMERYDCSSATAEKYIREAKAISGGKLSKGKLLPAELALWENYIGGKDVRERTER